ncbi:MAG: two-component system nitrate/nitrite sensor histidine kinase NarX [Psychromonas sp.]|jgi:two-component system nitrate/nitrite sensor histidine kinase NarX|uniref:histidine kinase n=1 Tax=Psychromonas sp. TaxID=1884585 RepID=UPI0039E4618C
MNHTDENNGQTKKTSSSSSSLVVKTGRILAVIITFSLISMISSIFVTLGLSGDAEQINHAGALRMHAMQISRAHLLQSSDKQSILIKEIKAFDTSLNHLFLGGITRAHESDSIGTQYQKIQTLWLTFKNPQQKSSIEAYDQFVNSIDQLVTLLQLESEKKLSFLRLIQGLGLLSTLIISLIVLVRLKRTIILPLRQLVKVASELGKGHFHLKADYQENDELGVLAATINQMSQQLQSTYQDYEERVSIKTQELMRSNQSLQVLYHAADNLALNEFHQTDQQIIEELETALGFGKVCIERQSTFGTIECVNMVNGINVFCLECLNFPLEKSNQLFGHLIWHFPKNENIKEWQKQLLQTMADIVATAIELEQKRNINDRLLIVEERAVIARELHDSLAQSLSYLKVQMSLLTRKMQKDVEKEQISETIEDIKQGLNSAYQQLRELLTTFRLKLDDPSIEKALQGTVAEFSAKCQHPIKLEFNLAQNFLSANQEIHVLQIVREALSNVHQHAKANNAIVSLRKNSNKVQVQIWDDGQGIIKSANVQGHFGLGIMKERAKSLNTLIDLQSDKINGTRVLFEFEYLL